MSLSLNNWEDPDSRERIELVFADRNKKFGAYDIRKNYERNILRALLLTCSTGLLLVLLPQIFNYIFPTSIPASRSKADFETVFENYIPEKNTVPVNPPPPQPSSLKPIGSLIPNSIPLIVDSTIHDDFPPQNKTALTPVTTGSNIDSTVTAYIPELPENGKGINRNDIPIWIQEMPVFIGGEKELLKYLSSHLHYPESAKHNGISGTVYVSFIISETGKVMDAEIEKGIGNSCDEEALRVISAMPDWKPGRQNGHSVMVKYILPVKFTLRE